MQRRISHCWINKVYIIISIISICIGVPMVLAEVDTSKTAVSYNSTSKASIQSQHRKLDTQHVANWKEVVKDVVVVVDVRHKPANNLLESTNQNHDFSQTLFEFLFFSLFFLLPIPNHSLFIMYLLEP